jgi:glycerophosphoryl diester phosphodiesterase
MNHKKPPSWQLTPSPQQSLIGHRGLVNATYPGNTIASFAAALALGLNWLELDIQLCSDGQWMVFHDAQLQEQTVTTLSSTTLLSLAPATPRLEEVYQLLQQQPMPSNLNIEIKLFEAALTPQYVEAFATWLSSHHLATLPLISSFNWSLLRALKQVCPQLPTGYLVECFSLDTINLAQAAHCQAIHSRADTFTEEQLHAAETAGLAVLLYTVNDPMLAQYWLSKGVTAIFTDSTPAMQQFFFANSQ